MSIGKQRDLELIKQYGSITDYRRSSNMLYKPNGFELYELVPRNVYDSFAHDKLWWVFDDRVLVTLARLRVRYGSTTVNNWYHGGDNYYRGYRPPHCTVGADLSQHRFGGAFDVNCKDATPDEIRQDIVDKKYPDTFEFITCIEMDIGWVHFDVRNWNIGASGILKVYP